MAQFLINLFSKEIENKKSDDSDLDKKGYK